MTEWLVHRFIHDADQTDRPDVRNAHGTLASIVCIVCNILLCTTKGLVGLAAGSVSVVADAVNNLTDASSNIVSLIGFKLASRPADKGHPFGHGRIEYMAGVVVAFIIVAVGLDLAKTSIQKIVHPEPADFSLAVVVALLLSIGVKTWMALFNHALATRIDSVTLEATSQDSKNDVLATSAVLAAGMIGKLCGIDLDGVAGLAVGAFIMWSGFELVRETLDPLLGQAPDPKLVSHIHDTIMSYPGVLGTHDLMVHDYGPGRQFASAHVEMPGEGDAFEHHEILDTIEHDIKRQMGIDITLHCDPIATTGDDLRGWVKRGIMQIDPALSIHDLHEHDRFVSFDLVRPDGFDISDEELLELVTRIVHERRPDASCVVTFDSGFSSPERPAEQL